MNNILVLCTGNSCRSQMAEGYLRKFLPEEIKVLSAGIETHGVNPDAVAAMKEDGVDISEHTSNHIDEYSDINFDLVITVCDNARERCPVFPTKAAKNHQNFPDPAGSKGSKAEIAAQFRRVRDMIKEKMRKIADDVNGKSG